MRPEAGVSETSTANVAIVYGGRGLAPASEPSDERTSPISLHAWRIEFTNPETSLPIAVTCPPPAYQPWTTYTGHM